MRRALVIFLTLVLLWTVVAQIDHALSPWGLSVFAGGLFIAYAAVALPARTGLAAAHAVALRVRGARPKGGTEGVMGIALYSNLAMFTALTMFELGRSATA